jgi:hypothetical protein
MIYNGIINYFRMKKVEETELTLHEMMAINGGKDLGYYLGYMIGYACGEVVCFLAGVGAGISIQLDR